MSEDRRKLLRTQGKYSSLSSVVVNSNEKGKRNRDKGPKSSPPAVDSSTKKTYERTSEDSQELDNSTDETISSVRYEKDSDFSFSQLENVKKPVEIKEPGEHLLSVTENGESKILFDPCFLRNDEANEYYDYLFKKLDWDEKNIVINGQEYPQPRLVTWFGPFPYSYSGTTLEPAEMPPVVKEIKERVEQNLKKWDIDVSFNSVLLNLYRNGKDSVAWHSDDELTMGISPTIASVSLGETRKFEMRPKIKYYEDPNSSDQLDDYLVHLTHGSLVIMTGCMQEDWQHRIPKEYHDKYPRINLTFRTVYPLEKIPEHTSDRKTKKEKLVTPNYHRHSSGSGINLDDEDFPPLDGGNSHLKNNLHRQSLNGDKTKDDGHNVSGEVWDVEPCDEEKNSYDSRNGPLSKHRNNITSNKYEGRLIHKDSHSFDNCSKESVYSPLNVTEENNLDKETPNKWHYKESHSSINTNQDHNFDKMGASKKLYLAQEKADIKNFDKYADQKNISKNRHDYKGYSNDNEENSHFQDNYPDKFNNHELNLNIKENNNDFNIKRNYEVSLPGEKKRFSARTECDSGVKGFVRNDRKEVSNSTFKSHPKKEHKEGINSRNYENHKDFSRKEHSRNFRDIKNKSHFEGNIENEDRRRHAKRNHIAEPLLSINTAEKNDFEKTESAEECYNHEFHSPTDTTHRINSDGKESPKGLNVEAKEFIPINLAPNTANQYQQNSELENLLHYQYDLMEGEKLRSTSFALTHEVWKRISVFKKDDREELEFLCTITDGSQTDKNQRLISCRICDIVRSALAKSPPRNQRPFKENPRHRDFDHRNHYSDKGRKERGHFQYQSRSGDYKH